MTIVYAFGKPPDSDRWVKEAFSSIVAQKAAVEQLGDLCFSALQREDHCLPVNLMLVGPASVGKTLLARTVAKCLATVFVETDATQIRNNDVLIEKILTAWIKEYTGYPKMWSVDKPDLVVGDGRAVRYDLDSTIVFIDEIHALSRNVQDGLLKATERSDMLLYGKDKTVLHCGRFTWIGATTDWGKLSAPFRTRFRRVQCYPYSPEEVAEIVRRNFGWSPELCAKIVYYAGSVPRIAKDFATAVKLSQERYSGDIKATIEQVARREGIDERGFRREHKAILQACQEGAILRQLKQAVGCEQEELVQLWLPVLVQKGLVHFTDKYYLTERGQEEIGESGGFNWRMET